MERRYITEALIRSRNSKQKASKMLGITTRTLHRKSIELNIENEQIMKFINERYENKC